MALSNIFREPCREITESVVGIAVTVAIVGGFGWADYEFARWLRDAAGCAYMRAGACVHNNVPIVLGMLGGLLAAVLAVIALYATHAIGDEICNALQARGIHLRPRNRPRQ